MSNQSATFVDACLAGNAFATDVDDWVDAWHDSDFEAAPNLDDYLGFSEQEGKLWAEKPSALGAIIASRKYGVQVEEVLRRQSDYGLAARSVSERDAHDVLQWLIRHGRVDAK